MTMRAAAAAAPRGFCRFFCTKPTASSPTVRVPLASGATSALKTAEPNEILFVTGLNKRTTSETLREAFKKFGEVKQARVVADRVSGYSKGFGYVKYATSEDAAKGIQGMDGKFLEGWIVFAEYARPRTNAIASQTHHTEPSHSKPEEKKTTPEKNDEMKKETAGKKKNKEKKITAKVVADQPMDKDKDKK